MKARSNKLWPCFGRMRTCHGVPTGAMMSLFVVDAGHVQVQKNLGATEQGNRGGSHNFKRLERVKQVNEWHLRSAGPHEGGNEPLLVDGNEDDREFGSHAGSRLHCLGMHLVNNVCTLQVSPTGSYLAQVARMFRRAQWRSCSTATC
jgi:hypothetical protein